MAITTQDGIVAALPSAQKLIINKASVTAVAGRLLSLWPAAGQPGAGSTTVGQAATGAVPTSTTTGAFPFTNPASGFSYLGLASGQNVVTGNLRVYDILWVWGSGGSGWSATTTGAQNTSSPAALTRPDADGVGTELWMETLAAGGAASGTSTVTYTNTAGTGSRSASLLASKITSPPIGTVERYALQAGDLGVKSVQTLNNSATWTSGTFRLMIVREIASIPCIANFPVLLNAFDLGLPLVYDNACIGLFFDAYTTSTGPTEIILKLIQG